MPRTIDDVLKFRGDLSPFLVHLTRDLAPTDAPERLRQMLQTRQLSQSGRQISDARFGRVTVGMSQPDLARFFGAISFTETPLAEVHSMLDIEHRSSDFKPYGLVFVKDRLIGNGVEPVIMLNNLGADKDPVVRAFCRLIDTDPGIAESVLPLIAFFGTRLTSPGAPQQTAQVDFSWERE